MQLWLAEETAFKNILKNLSELFNGSVTSELYNKFPQ